MATGNAQSAFRVDGTPVERAQFDRVALDPRQSVVIQACAGSGKTWLLVARLLRLLLAGAEPGEILAITFTRKAAQEMHARLVKLLEDLALADDDAAIRILVERGLDAHEARLALPRARGLFEKVQRAARPLTIETFHGWFGRIVRGAPLVAGVPAGFGVAERTDALRNEARREFLNRAGREALLAARYRELLGRVGEHNAWEFIRALTARRNEWRALLAGRDMMQVLDELARELGVKWSTNALLDPAWNLEEDPRRRFLLDEDVAKRVRWVASILSSGTGPERARAARALELLAGAGEAFGEAVFEEISKLVELRKGGAAGPTRPARAAAQARWGDEGESMLVAAVERLAGEFSGVRETARDYDGCMLNALVWCCTDAFIAAFTEQKRARGVLDFDDLEWLAYSLSQDDASAAYIQTRLDARYGHVLVDEFQDTNPLQWLTLQSWLNAYGGDAIRPSVLLVGDPNQSIYRFRGAEARLFDQARHFLVASYGASELSTDETRRCAPEIVAALNGVFDDQQNPGFRPHQTQNQKPGAVMRLAPVAVEAKNVAKAASDAVPAEGLGLRDPLTQAREESESIRHTEEAVRIAHTVAEFIRTRTVTDTAARDGSERALRYSDVLVLVRRRANMAFLEKAFRAAHIPYASDRSGGLLATLEALDLGALLRFLVVPFSDHLLAHVLRTPIFDVGDADLIRLAQCRERGNTWWQRLQVLPDADPLVPVREQLARWIELAGVRPVHDLLDLIYYEGAVIERYVQSVGQDAQGSLGEQVRQNLLAYMELALETDSGRYPSLPRFIEELDALAKGSEQESPDEGDTDHGDTVRILTIHGAKGLESPIVFVTDACGGVGRSNSPGTLIDWPPGEGAPRHVSVIGSKDTRGPARAALLEQDRILEDQEDRNLLYVAATRAKEVLVISGVEPVRPDKEESWYGRCAPFAQLIETPAAAGRPECRPTAEADGAASEPVSIWIADFRPVPFPVGERREILAALDASEERARQRGIALHRVLELASIGVLDLQRARSIAQSEGLPADLAEEVAALVHAILNKPALRRFFDPQAYLRAFSEVEMVAPDGKLLRLDRLVEFHDETWVLDYKSSASASGIGAHEAQLARYRLALKDRIAGIPVRAGIIFADAVLVEL